MPVSLLKLILSENEDEKGKGKDKSWKKKLSLGGAFRSRKLSRISSSMFSGSKRPGTS